MGARSYGWCLVIDDESFQSIENGTEPIGPTPPGKARRAQLTRNASKVFVKLLIKDCTSVEGPEPLKTQSRDSGGQGNLWNG